VSLNPNTRLPSDNDKSVASFVTRSRASTTHRVRNSETKINRAFVKKIRTGN